MLTQVEFLLAQNATSDFYLTQIVSYHEPASVARFLTETRRRNLSRPCLFVVLYYRSTTLRTLRALAQFLDMPAKTLTCEFEAGATAITRSRLSR